MLLETRSVGGRISGERCGAVAARQDRPIGQPLDAQFVVIAFASAEEKIDRTIEQRGHQVRPLREFGVCAQERRHTEPIAAADRRAVACNE